METKYHIGDEVRILTGRLAGKEGKIIDIIPLKQAINNYTYYYRVSVIDLNGFNLPVEHWDNNAENELELIETQNISINNDFLI